MKLEVQKVARHPVFIDAKCLKSGRGERIRTSGPCLPKTVLYQAELLPDRMLAGRTPRGRGGPIGVDCHACKRAICTFSR